MAKKELTRNRKVIILPSFFVVLFLLFIIAPLTFYSLSVGKIYPGISVGKTYLGGLSKEEAKRRLQTQLDSIDHLTFLVPPSYQSNSGKKDFNLSLTTIDFKYNTDSSISNAFDIGHSGQIADDISHIAKLALQKANLGVSYSLDEAKLNKFISDLAGEATSSPLYPSINYENGKVKIVKGEAGTEIDYAQLRNTIAEHLAMADTTVITIPFFSIDPSLRESEVQSLQERAEKLIGKKIILTADGDTFTLTTGDIIEAIDPDGSFTDTQINEFVGLAANKFNKQPQEAAFIITPSSDGTLAKVDEFAPGKDGISVQIQELTKQLSAALADLENSEKTEITINVAITKVPPKIKTADVNNLGIKELLGRGTSRFKGSIPSRIYNVNLATNRLNGILVPPGETFSFDLSVGDVSKYTGYKEAYIIKDGKTILGDGGGLCQVSTTLFRAVLNAGLPIVERYAHAYRVGYYEQDSPPGIDATVYTPSVDFKFLNDTGHYILIQSKTDSKYLTEVFEIYGTSDGRKATISKPVITSQSPPPPDEYADDPTIPTGVIKQVDHAAWGAKVYFDYSVERNGENIYQKRFVSTYRPWSNKFLRGTGPAQ